MLNDVYACRQDMLPIYVISIVLCSRFADTRRHYTCPLTSLVFNLHMPLGDIYVHEARNVVRTGGYLHSDLDIGWSRSNTVYV